MSMQVPLTVTLPLEVFEVLERSATKEGRTVEAFTASMLAEVAEFGSPAGRYDVQRLATQMADLLAEQWEQRRVELIQVQEELTRLTAIIARITR
jgi:hypothetical protein